MIIEKYNRGVSFSDLVEVYNMDSNKKDGDLGWFSEGIMVKDFENAVRNQEKGNIFTIDIPDYNWYYVTLKTDNNTDITTIRALKVRNQ
jgi:parvulin-like peptidyl-prolyl isomerase